MGESIDRIDEFLTVIEGFKVEDHEESIEANCLVKLCRVIRILLEAEPGQAVVDACNEVIAGTFEFGYEMRPPGEGEEGEFHFCAACGARNRIITFKGVDEATVCTRCMADALEGLVKRNPPPAEGRP